MKHKIGSLIFVALFGGAGVLGYGVVRSELTGEVYRERLVKAHRDYGELREKYNTVVKKTAVAELVVSGGALSVQIRTEAGVDRVIDTPYDPYGEIYLDYVVFDGRLWVRRVYDAGTAPADGILIDPLLEEIDWEGRPLAHGKAVYRRLDEGRWVVSVTGDGSLGLSRVADDRVVELAASPEVYDYEKLDEQARAAADEIGVMDVVGYVWGAVWE